MRLFSQLHRRLLWGLWREEECVLWTFLEFSPIPLVSIHTVHSHGHTYATKLAYVILGPTEPLWPIMCRELSRAWHWLSFNNPCLLTGVLFAHLRRISLLKLLLCCFTLYFFNIIYKQECFHMTFSYIFVLFGSLSCLHI